MNLRYIKRNLILNLKNIPGWATDRKIVVFISDDWGDLRIRSEKDYQQLLSQGIPVDKSAHTRYETLATYSELEKLFEVLPGFKDKNGRNAVFTPFVIMANPDFEMIRESGFSENIPIYFSDQLKRTVHGHKTLSAWENGIKANLFLPEYHGRDHINVPMWMESLQKKDELVRECC